MGFSLGMFNDFIPVSVAIVNYVSVDDAVVLIMKCTHGALLVKFAIKSACQIFSIDSSDHFLFGMQWRTKIFITFV